MRRVIGLDIHRTFAEAVAWEEGRLSRLGRVDMTRTALEGFGKCLRPSDEVVVEATGNAMAVVHVLSPFVARVVIANPLQVKAIAHAHVKTDKIDAGVLASLHTAGFLPEVWTPDPETERLRRLVARRNQLVRHRTRIKNEVHAILHAHLIPRCPHADLFNRRGRGWLSRQPLPADEKATIDRHLRELDRLADDLEVLDREVAQGAIGNPSIERLITITGVNVTVAAGLRCSPQRRRRSRSCSRHRPAPAASSTAPGPGTKTGSGSRSPPINVRASRLSISLPSASALATLSTGRSISVPSSQRPAVSSTPRFWRTCSAMTVRMSPTSQPPSYKELRSVASSNDLNAARRAVRAIARLAHSARRAAHSLTLCQPCRLPFGDRCAANS
ncbi:MAG: transposase [Microvirga sp.]